MDKKESWNGNDIHRRVEFYFENTKDIRRRVRGTVIAPESPIQEKSLHCLLSSHIALVHLILNGKAKVPDCSRLCEEICHDWELSRSCLLDYCPSVSLCPVTSIYTPSYTHIHNSVHLHTDHMHEHIFH